MLYADVTWCGSNVMYTASQQQQQQQKHVSSQIPERRNVIDGEQSAMWWVALMLLLLLITCGAAQKSPIHIDKEIPRVCGNIDVRNFVSNFSQLEGCQVVEGDLQIGLISNTSGSGNANTNVNNLSFPLLREVTGFVLFYRVNGLQSLGKLFPNLAVIRGRTLFGNYALVVYELQDLTEIGLHSLTNILRGSVRLEKNPQLCYVDTINWNHIDPVGENGHFIKENRPREDCPRCPSNILTAGCLNSSEVHCWNKNYCQKEIALDSNQDPCDKQCLGGCYGSSPKDCVACRNLLLNGQCVQTCPPNTYEYIERRCLTEEECYNQLRPISPVPTSGHRHPFRPIQGQCVMECPTGFIEKEVYVGGNKTRFQCVPCEGVCKKKCVGSVVDSIAAAQKLALCTYITGSGLEIRLRYGGTQNLMRELEKSLSSIEEIDGYLKVVRSFPLVSLNFLKNLKVIHGNVLDNYNSSFVLLDNQNLQELFVQEKRLTIKKGKLFFHFNPRLCYDKIEKFVRNTGLPPPSESEAPRHSNGDKEACNVTPLNVTVELVRPTSVLLSWIPFENYDPRTLLGYVVSYVKAPYRNVTYYDGRDACGADGWHVDDVSSEIVNPGDPKITKPITKLEPFTQYAFYVRTYIIKYETNGGRSNIDYFKTAPGTPWQPRFVEARATSSSEIVVSWLAPPKIYGILRGYQVNASIIPDELPLKHFGEFCGQPVVVSVSEHESSLNGAGPTVFMPSLPDFSEDSCPCSHGHQEKEPENEADRVNAISFENALQNHMYPKRINLKKRSVPESEFKNDLPGDVTKRYALPLNQPPRDGLAFQKMVQGTTVTIPNAVHFTRYYINVTACREPLLSGDSVAHCSPVLSIFVRTRKNESADIIQRFFVERPKSNDSTAVTLKWAQPEQPNGLIHSYQIERTYHDKSDSKMVQCVESIQGLALMSHSVGNLPPGKYSFRIRAHSLAGLGPLSHAVSIHIEPPSTAGLADVWYGVIVAIVFISVLILAFIWYWRRTYPPIPLLYRDVNPDYVSASSVYIADDWEVPRDKIELIRELGQGSFGMVYEGIAHDLIENQPRVSCAVKTVNETANDRDRHEFLNEASVMKAFNTHHVVRLLGVVSLGQPTLVIMELMSNGDLKTYLRNHRPEASTDSNPVMPPTLKRIMQMAVEIADGMAYLTAKKFVHRDLAARNCMVAADLTVKIGDFGMTRDIYETDYYKKGTKGLLPVRWMAPESLKDGVFTSRSDIWSYGVVLWEMVTLASQPYLGLSNDQVLKYVIEGGVMERPENCPDKLYELMQLCWQHKPHLRPPFMELVTRLLPDANEAFATHSFYFSPEAHEIRTHEVESQIAEYGTPLTAPIELLDSEDFGSVCSEPCSDNEGEDSNVLALLAPSRPSAPAVVSSSDSSRGSKVSNGSAQLNGYVTNTTSC